MPLRISFHRAAETDLQDIGTPCEQIFARGGTCAGTLATMSPDEPIRVTAPNTAAAMALVADLAALGRPDLVPLGDEVWEVHLFGAGRTPLPEVLHVVETWLGIWGAGQTTVHIAGRPRTLVARDIGSGGSPGV